MALLIESVRVVEKAWPPSEARLMQAPYGTPHGLNPGDFGGTSSSGDDHYLVPDGDSDADDGTTYLALFGASNALSDTTGSSDPGDGEYGRPNGVIDSDDYFYFLDRAGDAAALGRNVLSAGHDGSTASHGAGNLRNRKGLAGYEWDPHVRRYHVRNRVLYPETGRWTRRDPLGYVDGMGLYEYARTSPVSLSDRYGECASGTTACSQAIDVHNASRSTLIGGEVTQPGKWNCRLQSADQLCADRCSSGQAAGMTYCRKGPLGPATVVTCCVCDVTIQNRWPHGAGIVSECADQHEGVHLRSGCPRPTGKAKACEEMGAYGAELDCLRDKRASCSQASDPAQCEADIDDREDSITPAWIRYLTECVRET